MAVVVTESDNGTKQKVMDNLNDINEELPSAIMQELDAIWMAIWMDAIAFSSKTMDTGALAASINVIEGGMGEGGGMGLSRTPRQPVGNWIFDRSITAGDVSVVNPKTGKTTAMYADWVHDGHAMRDGTFWQGNPFLTDALDAHEAELEAAVEKAMKEMESLRQGSE